MKTFTLTIFLAIISSCAFAQNRQIIDSLKHELGIAKHDTSRVLLMCKICSNYRDGNADSTLYYGNKALELANKINFLRGKFQAMRFVSYGHENSGNLPKALELSLKSIKIAENNFSKDEENRAANRLGNIYSGLGDFSKALIYFKRVILIFEETNQTSGYQYCTGFMNIGTQFEGLNQLDSAEYYFQKSLQALKKHKFEAPPQIYRHLGNVQFALGNMPLAFSYYQKSIQTKNIKNSPLLYSNTLNALSKYYQKVNNLDSSLYYANQALIQASLISSKNRYIIDAAMQLSKLYEAINTDKAFRYYKMAVETRESLYGKNSLEAIQTIADQEEEQQREIEANQIRYQNQLKQYALLAGLGVLLLIALFLYLNNKKEKKAKNQLQEKNQVIQKTLTELKATQTQLIQSEKLASLGELTAGIAHEIQNPLNFVNNFSEVSSELVGEMNQELDKGDIKEAKEIANDLKQNLEKINLHGKRASSIVKGMLEHSRTSTGVKEPTDLNALVDEYLRLSYHGIRGKDNSFKSDFELIADENLPKIEVIPQDMGRVFLNLINNAFWAVNERNKKGEAGYQPKVTVSTQLIANSQVLIAIKDNGIGMTEEVKAKIFQPFFTTKPTGQGTGLGLSLAYDIVTKGHGGMIECKSVEGEGTKFVVKLPI